MGNGAASEGGQVPDRIHFGVRLPDFLEHVLPRPTPQLQPFNGHGVPARSLPRGEFALPGATDMPTYQTASTPDDEAVGQYLCQVMERGAKARQKLVDQGEGVEAH